ncbi:hypothetical protein M885DRAFT_556661 [Pelagophyceae sp. CCMP2097]|nr:hypothetical protein M885DRAFT_556661 [Pelagophyceae sp. CCMP2097]
MVGVAAVVGVLVDWASPAFVNTPSKSRAARRQDFIQAHWENERTLGAHYVRHVPCPTDRPRFPYPHLAVPELSEGFWDFSYIDHITSESAFMKSAEGRPVVMNFATMPEWLFKASVEVPEDANRQYLSYEQSAFDSVRSVDAVCDYFERLFRYYTQGGMTDEQGVYHAGFNYTFEWVEVLNEPNYEHGYTANAYTALFDAIVERLRSFLPPATKYLGLALAAPLIVADIEYFLDASHHDSVPVDGISYHFYAQPLSANASIGCVAPDGLLDEVYWSTCAASYAYILGGLALQGVNVAAMSQMLGFPAYTLDGVEHLEEVLQMLIDQLFGLGDKGALKTETDASETLFAQAFAVGGDVKVLLVSFSQDAIDVTLNVPAANATLAYSDLQTGRAPYASANVDATKFRLGPLAVAVLTLHT